MQISVFDEVNYATFPLVTTHDRSYKKIIKNLFVLLNEGTEEADKLEEQQNTGLCIV